MAVMCSSDQPMRAPFDWLNRSTAVTVRSKPSGPGGTSQLHETVTGAQFSALDELGYLAVEESD